MSIPVPIEIYTTKEDKVDANAAADMNKVQTSIITIETALNALCNLDGSMVQGSSFPGSPTPGQLFLRTDLNILYFRNAANSAWVGISQQISCFLAMPTSTATPAALSLTGGFDKNSDIVTNQFKAPIAARYVFHVHIQFTDSSVNFESPSVALRKNTTTVATGYVQAGGITSVMTMNANIDIILDLAAGDLIDIVISPTTHAVATLSNIAATWFSGSILNGT